MTDDPRDMDDDELISEWAEVATLYDDEQAAGSARSQSPSG